MKADKELDLIDVPLEGINLTEASAGTGKTYAISALFLRLVLEKNLSVNEILVVTFTEAATEELKGRIRGKLRGAVKAFSGEATTDTFLNGLVRKTNDSEVALRRLKEALRAFDRAAIFTIHGFCRRILHENAFETGSLFDTELVADQEDLKGEIVDDYWRKHFYYASPLFIHYTINNKVSPDSLLALLGNKVAQRYVRVIPSLEPGSSFASCIDSSLQEKEYLAAFKRVCQGWQSHRQEALDILTTYEGLNRGKYKKANIPDWGRGMDGLIASGGNNPVLFSGFEKFTPEELERGTKKDCTPPRHPFFVLCEELKNRQEELTKTFEHRLVALKVELFHYVRNELARRKREKNIQSFDDLLIKVYRALQERDGEVLARSIRMKYKAALIDEFQDTDPIQYSIFKKAFGSGSGTLFLIGDPKQAIYSFRNADIFAYMEAASNVESRYTLGENWRSEPDLITAVNTIFAKAQHPFIYNDIPFQAAMPAKKEGPGLFEIDAQSKAPLQLWFLSPRKMTGVDKPMTKSQARELIPRAVAWEISRLLELGRKSKAFVGKKPLGEEDIAVLVRKNAEAHLMQEALSNLNIPSVLHTTEDLFESHEALEMERLLTGIVEPNNERLLKTALATDMIGVKGKDLDGFMADEPKWERWVVKFEGYHDMWNKNGFMRMFRHLLLEEQVMTRLMWFPDGERRNTNVLHLSEVLHQACVREKLGMAGLLKWLVERRNPATLRLAEHQLRLESDENAVKLVTVHKSKGLEYPVVFCPFTWDGSRIRNRKEPFVFHDEENDMRLTLDLGSQNIDRNRRFAEKEVLAENLRLLYVALTRAKNRCYIVWGRINEAETSAPAYLFHPPGSRRGKQGVNIFADPVSSTGKRFGSLSDEEVVKDLKTIQREARGAIGLFEMPTEAGSAYLPAARGKIKLSCRRFSGNIDRSWRISSFSSLASNREYSADVADHDAVEVPAGQEFLSSKAQGPGDYDEALFEESALAKGPSDIFAFPAGAKAGTFMHDIFEHLDFTQETLPMEQLVEDKLLEYSFELSWRETICSMIRKVLSVPLDPSCKDLTLSRIRNEDRLNELAFYFPLQSISPKKLKGLFEKHGGPELSGGLSTRIERLNFEPVSGFMKGFIDMVFRFEDRFYLVDWKSNFLGDSVQNYDQESLGAIIAKAFYDLQYHIYLVALDRYLKMRLRYYDYEKHFGWLYYIFLRGVDPDRGADFGVFRARPSGEFVEELSENLIE